MLHTAEPKPSASEADDLTLPEELQPPLSLEETAKALGVHVNTIYNLHHRGDLTISKILGKSVVYPSDLRDYRARTRTALKRRGR